MIKEGYGIVYIETFGSLNKTFYTIGQAFYMSTLE